jgi:hypothetical protein
MNNSPSNNDENNWGLRASYEYKYPGWLQSNPFVQAVIKTSEQEDQKYAEMTAPQIYRDLIVQEKLKQLDDIDQQVNSMCEFPEIKTILNDVINK